MGRLLVIFSWRGEGSDHGIDEDAVMASRQCLAGKKAAKGGRIERARVVPGVRGDINLAPDRGMHAT